MRHLGKQGLGLVCGVMLLGLSGCTVAPTPYWMHSDAEAHVHAVNKVGGETATKVTDNGPALPVRILYPARLTPAAIDGLYAAYKRYPWTHDWKDSELVRSLYSRDVHDLLIRDLIIKSSYFAAEYYRWLKDVLKDKPVLLEPYVLDMDAAGVPFPRNVGKHPTVIDVYFDCLPSVLRLEQFETHHSNFYGPYANTWYDGCTLDFGMEAPARVMVMQGSSAMQPPQTDDFLQVCLYPYAASPFHGWNIFSDFTRTAVPSDSDNYLQAVSAPPAAYVLEESVPGKITLMRKCQSARYANSVTFKDNPWFDADYIENPRETNTPFKRLWLNYGNHLADALDRADVKAHGRLVYAGFVSGYDPALAESLKNVDMGKGAVRAAKLQFLDAILKFENEYAEKVSAHIVSEVYLSNAGTAFRRVIQNEETLRRQLIIQSNTQENAQLLGMISAMSSLSGSLAQMHGQAMSPMMQTMAQAVQTMAQQTATLAQSLQQQTVLTGEQGETFKVTADNLISVYLNVSSGAIEVTGKNLDELRAKFKELYLRRFGT